jgi:hypothetical protein
MKPSPSYTGPILTSLATLFAAGGACLYAVNVQKIFGGMRAERESSFELILCGFLPSSFASRSRFSFSSSFDTLAF